jgi:predicted nucleic acid-binding protein
LAEPRTDGVVDAPAVVELLLASARGRSVAIALERFRFIHAPAHLDAEVLSALGRLHRAGQMSAGDVADRLADLQHATIRRHPLAGLLTGAWARRERHRLADALYVELADALGALLLTTDSRLATAAGVDPVGI